MNSSPKPIIEISQIDFDRFHNDIFMAGKPAIIKNLVNDWPCIKSGQTGLDNLAKLIKSYSSNKTVGLSMLKHEYDGRFFFKPNMDGFNYTNYMAPLHDVIDWLIEQQNDPLSDSAYMQALDITNLMPAFAHDHPMPLLKSDIRPTMWIGNSLRTQTHCDFQSNIACVVSGKRRFTLFPPDQAENLYIGPIENTPGGVPLSMVSLDEPDLARFPKFKNALEFAQSAELNPGDAIYIPYGWWHHVRSEGPLNILVNYWWNGQTIASPMAALYASILTIRDLPEHEKIVWKRMLDTYVFGDTKQAVEHIPQSVQGILGPLTEASIRQAVVSIKSQLGIK